MTYIESLHISSFAGITNRDIRLENGLNIITGSNEAGKSTVAEFIRFMLYGLEKKSDRDLFEPFSSHLCSGNMIICSENSEYLVERTENGTKKSLQISKDGHPFPTDKSPGLLFFNIPDADLFTSTVYTGRGGTGLNGQSTAEAVENLLFSGDEKISPEKAIAKLETLRKELMPQKNGNGTIRELENLLSTLNGEKYQSAEDDRKIEEINRQISEINDLIADSENKLEDVRNNQISWLIKKQREEVALLEKEGREADEAQSLLESYEKAHSRLDRMPNKGDRDELLAARTNLQNEARDLALARKNISVLEKDLSDVENLIEERRAENRPIIEKLIKKRKIISVAATICFALLIISLIIIFWGVIKKTYALCYIFSAFSVILIASMGIHLWKSKNVGTKIYSLEDINDLQSLIYEYESSLSNAKLRADEEKREFSDSCDEYRKRAMKWGLYPASAVRTIDDIIETFGSLRSNVEKYSIKYMEHKTSFELRLNEPDAVMDDGRAICLPDDYDDRTFSRLSQQYTRYIEAQEKRKVTLQINLAGLKSSHRSVTEIEEQICEITPKLEQSRNKHSAVVLAVESLKKAETDMRMSVFPRLSKRAGEFLSGITSDKYCALGVDDKLGLTFNPKDETGAYVTKDTRYMSGGTFDAAYICLRLALSGLISEKNPPMILDESLVRLDDCRLESCLRMLSESGIQTIVFTSSDRETRMTERCGIKACTILI